MKFQTHNWPAESSKLFRELEEYKIKLWNSVSVSNPSARSEAAGTLDNAVSWKLQRLSAIYVAQRLRQKKLAPRKTEDYSLVNVHVYVFHRAAPHLQIYLHTNGNLGFFDSRGPDWDALNEFGIFVGSLGTFGGQSVLKGLWVKTISLEEAVLSKNEAQLLYPQFTTESISHIGTHSLHYYANDCYHSNESSGIQWGEVHTKFFLQVWV